MRPVLINGNTSEGNGGGVTGDGTVTVAASIVAGNSAPTGPNCHVPTVTDLTSLGSNLSDDDSCPFTANGDVQNSTSVNLGSLADNGGETETMLPAPDSDAIDSANCALSTPLDQRGFIRPQGAGCDNGAVEVLIAETLPLCVSLYTGAVSSPWSGQCSPYQQEIDPVTGTFCINPYTGQIHYAGAGQCAPFFQTHLMPDDGALLTCVSRYTGGNRGVDDHSQCTPYELLNVISATP